MPRTFASTLLRARNSAEIAAWATKAPAAAAASASAPPIHDISAGTAVPNSAQSARITMPGRKAARATFQP